MMKLYEIDNALEAAINACFDAETGEILDESKMAEIEALEIARADKIEGILLYIKNLSADAEVLKAEEKRLSERRKVKENKTERLKEFVQRTLSGEKFETAKVKVSYRKTESVEVQNVFKIPEDFLRYKDPDPDKVAIKKAIKAGEKIEGATLVENISMTIK